VGIWTPRPFTGSLITSTVLANWFCQGAVRNTNWRYSPKINGICGGWPSSMDIAELVFLAVIGLVALVLIATA
jgi:hypothetical protein